MVSPAAMADGETVMARIDWRICALEINTCNCAWGCPCQFNARPTRGIAGPRSP